MSRGLGKNQQKILLLLLAGVALGLSGSPKKYFYILKKSQATWKKINNQELKRAIISLYTSHHISETHNNDGTTTIKLTQKGKQKALTHNIETIQIKKHNRWDKKWRVVLFDIPEKRKKDRNVLRYHLKRLKFFELQKSVFVSPYNCKKEIQYIIEFYMLKPYVRFIIAESIDNELHIKTHFKFT